MNHLLMTAVIFHRFIFVDCLILLFTLSMISLLIIPKTQFVKLEVGEVVFMVIECNVCHFL